MSLFFPKHLVVHHQAATITSVRRGLAEKSWVEFYHSHMPAGIDCSKVITIPQFGGTCWFHVVLMLAFFSEGMRKLLLHKYDANTAGRHKAMQMMANLLRLDVVHRQLTGCQKTAEECTKEFFEQYKPMRLLAELHKMDPVRYDHNPCVMRGHPPLMYLQLILDENGVTDSLILNAEPVPESRTKTYQLSHGNLYGRLSEYVRPKMHALSEQAVKRELDRTPDVLLIRVYPSWTSQVPAYAKKSSHQVAFNPTITFNGATYKADGLCLANHSEAGNSRKEAVGKHAIAGVTCGGQRYIFNGWVQRSRAFDLAADAAHEAPCHLMFHDWLNPGPDSFDLDTDNCALPVSDHSTPRGKLLFHAEQGHRTYVYIRSDALPPTRAKTTLSRSNTRPKVEAVELSPLIPGSDPNLARHACAITSDNPHRCFEMKSGRCQRPNPWIEFRVAYKGSRLSMGTLRTLYAKSMRGEDYLLGPLYDKYNRAEAPAELAGALCHHAQSRQMARNNSQQTTARTPAAPLGLPNRDRVTCWLNSLVQMLRVLPELATLPVMKDYLQVYSRESGRKASTLRTIKQALGLPTNHPQQDVHEQYQRLADAALIDQSLFGMQVVYARHSRGNEGDPFYQYVLLLTLPENRTRAAATLQSRIDDFFAAKEVAGQGQERLVMLSPPTYLLMLVVRWEATNDRSGERPKSQAPVVLSEEVELPERHGIYTMVGLIVHIGESSGSGHYIAYVKHSSTWYRTSDMDVTEVTLDDVLEAGKKDGYMMLFSYKRPSTSPPSVPVRAAR